LPRYEFTTGQVLTAGELNDLSDQTVMVFAGTAARGSAIPSPSEGMVTYLSDADELQVYTTDWGGVGGGKILQVVSSTKVDSFTTSSTSFVDVADLSVSITPSSASSKVLVMATVTGGEQGAGSLLRINLVRDSTNISQSTGGSSTNQTSFGLTTDTIDVSNVPIVTLDSPSTTSSVTYKIQVATPAGTISVNRRVDSATTGATSSITVMEVAG